MVDWDCSCWVDYPNESHKCKNGHWKCVDRFEFVGVSENGCTHCKRRWILPGYRLPKEGMVVHVTVRAFDTNWLMEPICYGKEGWNTIPAVKLGLAEVIAWMPVEYFEKAPTAPYGERRTT